MVAEGFALDNFRGGYAYEPTGLSPEVRPSKFFWKEPAPGEYICGPALRYYQAGKGTDLTLGVGKEKRQEGMDQDGFNVKRLPGGPLLIRDGPHTTWSKFGSGECGACPRPELVIYSLDENLKLSELLQIYDVVGNEILDMDIQISPDWSRVGVYREKEGTWEDEFYCLKDRSYVKCGAAAHTPPPLPRTLKPYLEDQ
jgi:hypothetical protein